MYPSIKNGDTVVVYNLGSFLNSILDVKIKSHSVYTLENPKEIGPYFIKRNFGDSNDNLQMITTQYLNFLSEISNQHPRIRAFKKHDFEANVLSSFSVNNISEPKNNDTQKEYFFLSDWPFGTEDSRDYGYFSSDKIKGKVIWVF